MSSSSSADVIPGSSSNVVIPGLIGNLTDARDGQTYRTVTIGTQTWMAENLNYETENSYCYGDDASNCTKYGRLYTWAAAMDSVGTWSTNGKGCGDNKTCSPTYPVRGVCPEGWHLPTRAEFKTLITAVGGESIAGQKLKSTTGWTACSGIINEDAFAFSALPAGYRNDFGGYFNEGYDAYFWSSTESNSSLAYRMYLYYYDGYADLDNGLKNYGFSVRCLRDEGTTLQSSSSTKISSSSDTPESSSSEAKLSSSSVTPQSSDSETSVSTGTITDPRDGRIYKTVTIGSQTWMAQNLNYETGNSYCYKDSASYCSKYGRLYTWEAATTACLDGWHLPTEEEFETLFTAVGGQSIAGQKLKFATGWTAYSGITNEDAFAFSALPAGYRYGNGGYNDEGYRAYFWSSTEGTSDDAYDMCLLYSYGSAYLGDINKNYGFSVRCLRD